MKIYLASDHAGFELKNAVREHLFHKGYDIEDVGPETLDPTDDYPVYAFRVTTKMLGDEDDDVRGIMVCGSGQGMAIAANRVRGIRAVVAWNEEEAKASRHDDDANVLALAARFLDQDTAFRVSETFLEEPFSHAPRHKRRIEEIEELYG